MASLTLNTLSLVSGLPVTILSGSVALAAGTDPVWSDQERNAALDAALALCNGGSIEVCSAAFAAVLATFTLQNPAYNAAAAGVAALILTGLTVNAGNTGTAAKYRLKTSGGSIRRTGDVGT